MGGALLVFLALPIFALLSANGPRDILAGLRDPVTASTLILSCVTTAISLTVVVVFGTPLAWWLAKGGGGVHRVVELFVQIPIVTPPAVAGLALLLAFGRRGMLGPLLGALHVQLSFTTAAVVIAQVFVSAPFYVQTAAVAFASVDQDVKDAAQTLGAGPALIFFRVAVPLARPGLIAGAAMSWARALGEFGATLMFAGNLPGRTQTLPLAIYTAMESDLRAAQALALILVVVSCVLLVALRGWTRNVVYGNASALVGRPEPLRPR
jgi:molybdate transport system permease protein